ncbi:hypothetical protein [Pseudomonas edaphica]|nr:hypothetical protein [Pseudomonas edaphica]
MNRSYKRTSITADDATDQSVTVDEEESVQSAEDAAEPVDSPEQ